MGLKNANNEIYTNESKLNPRSTTNELGNTYRLKDISELQKKNTQQKVFTFKG